MLQGVMNMAGCWKGFILLVALIPKPHTAPASAAACPNKNGALIMAVMLPVEPWCSITKTPTGIGFAGREGRHLHGS